jgi:hypothetical protein
LDADIAAAQRALALAASSTTDTLADSVPSLENELLALLKQEEDLVQRIASASASGIAAFPDSLPAHP